MGIFSSIMSKLGFGDEEQTENKITAEAPAVENAASEPETVESAIEAMPEIDVIAKLESLSADNPGLNWQTSIVDLLKLLGLDSAYAHRKELAAEMGIDGYEGTAEQNIALHKAVLAKIAENGGNIPQELL
ncbi:MAG: DUF3597 domain-containing protein [Sulfurovum sp.]|nr:DUF3597 domain-containing protein [Sulfurovum sp.]